MKIVGKLLFKISCLWDQRISPSFWTLCNATPVHARICVEKYNLGLGCNTMEGREQKHQMISKYCNNTTFQNRWPAIFRHEFIQLIYLRENGYDQVNYTQRSEPYIPSNDDSCLQCFGKTIVLDRKCKLCSSVYQTEIDQVIKKF